MADSLRSRRARAARRKDLAPLAPVLEASLDELTDRLTDSLREEIPEYADLAREDLHRDSAAQLNHVYAELLGRPAPDDEGPEKYGRRRAEQGIPPEAVLRVYRIAWTELWDGLVHAATAHGLSRDWLLEASTKFLWIADNFAQRMLVSYKQRSYELLLRTEVERGAMLESLLKGFTNGPDDVYRAASVLDLPYEGSFVVVVAATAAPGEPGLPEIQALLQAKGLHSAWRLGPELETGIVSLRKAEFREVLLQRLRQYTDCRVGVSPPFDRLTNASRALHMARLVLGTLREGESGVREFDESALAALLAVAPETAQEIRTAVLGPILDLPRDEANQLLEALTAWFDSGGDMNEAAKRLYVHVNTVRYRLRKFQTITGRRLDDPRQASLLLMGTLAEGLLPHPEDTPQS